MAIRFVNDNVKILPRRIFEPEVPRGIYNFNEQLAFGLWSGSVLVTIIRVGARPVHTFKSMTRGKCARGGAKPRPTHPPPRGNLPACS